MDNIHKLTYIDEIRNLKSRYFRFMDTKDWQGLATVFSREATFDARGALQNARIIGKEIKGTDSWLHHGRDEIVQFISSTTGTTSTVHHGHGHEISITSDLTAEGIIAMQDHNRYYTIDGSISGEMLGYGHYEEKYIFEEGAWRINYSRLTRIRVDLEMF